MKCSGRSAFLLESLLLCVMAGLVFVACNGGGASREPAGDTRRPTLPTASPWPRPTLPTGQPQSAGTPEAGDAEAPLPTVSPEELSAVGGDPPRPGEIDACSLVTKAEVEQIIEQQVVDVWRHTYYFGETNICEYFSDGEPFGSAVIRLESGVSEERLQELEFAERFPSSGVFVYDENTILWIAVIVKDDPDPGAEKKLASIALQRLSQYTPPSP